MSDKQPLIVRTARRASGLVENLCVHGVGHPAFGSVHWLEIHGVNGTGTHGCDGCCTSDAWRIQDLTAGIKIANERLAASVAANRILAQDLPDASRAWKDGWRCFLAEWPLEDNPYDPAKPQHLSWHAGWTAAQKDPNRRRRRN